MKNILRKSLIIAKQPWKTFSEDDPFWFSWAWFSYGVAYFSNGELLESSKAFNNAFEYGKKSGNIYLNIYHSNSEWLKMSNSWAIINQLIKNVLIF